MGRPSPRVRSCRRVAVSAPDQKQQQPSTLSSTFNSIIPGHGKIRDYYIGALVMYALLQVTRSYLGADQVLCAVTIGVLLLTLLHLPLAQKRSEHRHTRPKTDVLRRTQQYKKQRVAKRRKRAKKNRDNRSHLLVRLSAIYDTTTPDHCREALAEGVSELARSCATLTTKTRRSAYASLWLHVQREALPTVRIHLLNLGFLLLNQLDRSAESQRYNRRAQALILQTLAEPHLQQAVHSAAFILFDKLLRTWSWSAVDQNRVLRACMDALQRHYETGETFSLSLKCAISFCMRECLEGDGAIGLLIDSEHTLHYLLDQVGPAKASCRDLYLTLSNTVHLILMYATQPERITIVARYFPLLERAIADMDISCVAEFMDLREYSGIALHCQPLLEQIALLLPLDRDRCIYYEEVCRLAAQMLDHALGDSDKLTELLGLGYLTSARWFAHDQYDTHGGHVAPIFSRVLAAMPCWRARFRKLTEDGPARNSVARLGRRQIIRPVRPCSYILL